MLWRIQGQVFFRQTAHVLVVLFLAVRMDVVVSFEAPDVSVEGRADVIQLVQDGDHLLAKTVLEKSRQVEREDVEHLAFALEQPLNCPLPPVALRCKQSVFKAERC